MVKFHTDLLDALANPDIKAKFSDLFSDSIQSTVQKSIDKAVQKAFDKHVGDLIAKIEELGTSVSTLRLQIESKNAVIADLQAKNDALSNEIADADCFYRSLSVCLYRHEKAHADIRQKVAQSIADKASCATPDDRAALLRRAAYVSRDKTWPGRTSSLPPPRV